jgi:F0F1-type ATP synthase membrane subunit b/b'
LVEREHAVSHARHEAASLSGQADERLTHLEARLATAREEVASLRTAARGRAQEQQATIINAARAEADSRVKQSIARLADEREAASQALKATTRSLSGEIAAQVLGRPVEG